MDEERSNALRRAFDAVKRRAGARRLAITIQGDGGLEVESDDSDKDDPDEEVYGLATDEDKELPGRRGR